MMRSEARVQTAEGERYAGLLCKHAEHMTMGSCSLTAEPSQLVLAIESDNPESLARMQRIIADNIARFAFREGVKVEWGPTELRG
jgi:hypothetical protein